MNIRVDESLFFITFASVMFWYDSVGILELIIKGAIIGIIASAGMGPVGVLCIQRTLNKGRWYGFVTGVGAAISDFIYALIVGLGMSFVTDFIKDERNHFYLQIIGSIVLLIFGILSYRSNPVKNVRQGGSKHQGTLFHNGWTAFLITLSNPLIIFIFTTCFALFAFVIPEHPIEVGLGFAGVLGGALAFWYVLTLLIDKLRHRFTLKTIITINHVMGIIVVLIALYMLIGTVTDLYSLPSIENVHR